MVSVAIAAFEASYRKEIFRPLIRVFMCEYKVNVCISCFVNVHVQV